MPKAQKSSPSATSKLRVPLADATKSIQNQISKGGRLLKIPIRSVKELDVAREAFGKWNTENAELLERIFDTPKKSVDYNAISQQKRLSKIGLEQDKIHFHDDVVKRIGWLEAVCKSLAVLSESNESSADKPVTTNEVFIVHGRNETLKKAVADFVKELGLIPVILHEQPNKGKTIIEKFEEYSARVAYAIIILSPDDIGGLFRTDPPLRLSTRARQNVVFEFGFFFGKLGRSRVCAIHTGNVELPSDLDGVLYIPFDISTESWKKDLKKEFLAAGLKFTPCLASA